MLDEIWSSLSAIAGGRMRVKMASTTPPVSPHCAHVQTLAAGSSMCPVCRKVAYPSIENKAHFIGAKKASILDASLRVLTRPKEKRCTIAAESIAFFEQ